jgi:RNA polymerase sigma factor (TIGR02999 family)
VERGDLTQLLDLAADGDPAARDALLVQAYDELKKLARSSMRRESPGHTLQPTALVNEAYLRLFGPGARWENRRHFFGAAAQAMRRVLVDQARRRGAGKRGGGLERVSLTQVDVASEDAQVDVLALDALLAELEAANPRLVRTIELRYFGGLDIEATAEVLGVAPATVKRDWAYARAWLLERLSG